MYKSKLYNWITAVLFVPFLGVAQPEFQLSPIPGNFDINSPNPLYALDINYDDIDLDRQAFHLFLPDTTGTYPLVIYIHGGGFTGGSRDAVLSNPSRIADVRYFLERGFAYASIGYRLISTTEADPDGVIKCLNDSKRALQYIRYFASDLYVNPDKIALRGGSAGAGTSLWLASRPDMADANASDPVLQASTRVCAVGLSASQATYDIYKWETEIYDNFDGQGTNYTIDSMANLLTFERFSNFYGGLDSNYHILYDQDLIQYREDVDMLFHLSSDDPPIYISSGSSAIHPSQDLFHHPFHGREINNVAIAANVGEVKATIPALGINTTEGESMNEFLERNLNACALTTSTVSNLIDNKVLVYPNPASSLITVESEAKMITNLELYSTTGNLVRSVNNIQSYSSNLSLSKLPKGFYILLVVDEQGMTQSRKLIIE